MVASYFQTPPQPNRSITPVADGAAPGELFSSVAGSLSRNSSHDSLAGLNSNSQETSSHLDDVGALVTSGRKIRKLTQKFDNNHNNTGSGGNNSRAPSPRVSLSNSIDNSHSHKNDPSIEVAPVPPQES
jgi:hypothetical protein